MPHSTPDKHPVEWPEVDQELLTRRRFLGLASGALSAVIAAGLGLPLVRCYIGNVFRAKQARWLKLGPAADVPVGQPQLFRSSYLDLDGWRQTTRRVAVYVVTQNRQDFTVFSSACTHLGCPVHWDEREEQFVCPCHGGGFSFEGEVVKGPAPRPLDQLEHKVENGALYIRIAEA